MPHLLKIRIDDTDSSFASMLDSGPDEGTRTTWGTVGPDGGYRARGDVRAFADGEIREGDLVVVRERRTASEVYFVALLRVVSLGQEGPDKFTPVYDVVERFDGSQPVDVLRALSPDLDALPHLQKNAKGMMLRAFTELTDTQLNTILGAVRDSIRMGRRPLRPAGEPGEQRTIQLPEGTLDAIVQPNGFFADEVYAQIYSAAQQDLPLPLTMPLTQTPRPKPKAMTRLRKLVLRLHELGASGVADELARWRADNDDPDLDLRFALRDFRPDSGLHISQFELCGVAYDSEESVVVYRDKPDEVVLVTGAAMRCFERVTEVVPEDAEDLEDLIVDLLDLLGSWGELGDDDETEGDESP